MIKDSGDRHQFDSGAVRDMQKGKGRCDLLPAAAILRLAGHFEAGAEKYGDRNWEKGIPINSFIDSAMRHILKYMLGQDDEDHLCAAAWNLLCAMETEDRFDWSFSKWRPEDDLPIPYMPVDLLLSELREDLELEKHKTAQLERQLKEIKRVTEAEW